MRRRSAFSGEPRGTVRRAKPRTADQRLRRGRLCWLPEFRRRLIARGSTSDPAKGSLFFAAYSISYYFAFTGKLVGNMGKRTDDLHGIRLLKRLTQAEVATRLKVSQSYYSMIERGEKPAEISEALKVVSGMRKRTDRTAGGDSKAGRTK